MKLQDQEGKQQRLRKQLQGRKGSSYRVGKEAAAGSERKQLQGRKGSSYKVGKGSSKGLECSCRFGKGAAKA